MLLGKSSGQFSRKIYALTSAIAYLFVVNRRRDKKYGAPDAAMSREAGMQDKTEFENTDFRYVL